MTRTRLRHDLQIFTGTEGDILVRDAFGELINLTLGVAGTIPVSNGTTLTYADPLTLFWGVQGNAGTNPLTDYVGTSDATNFHIKSNGGAGGPFAGPGTLYIGNQQTDGNAIIFIGTEYAGTGLQTIDIGGYTNAGASAEQIRMGNSIPSGISFQLDINNGGFNTTSRILNIFESANGPGSVIFNMGTSRLGTGIEDFNIGTDFASSGVQSIRLGSNNSGSSQQNIRIGATYTGGGVQLFEIGTSSNASTEEIDIADGFSGTTLTLNYGVTQTAGTQNQIIGYNFSGSTQIITLGESFAGSVAQIIRVGEFCTGPQTINLGSSPTAAQAINIGNGSSATQFIYLGDSYTGIGQTISIGTDLSSSTTRHLGNNYLAFNATSNIHVNESANSSMGVATLVAGTVTVGNTKIAASTRIFLTGQDSSGTHGELTISARTVGVGFTITSTSATDTRSVCWLLIEP